MERLLGVFSFFPFTAAEAYSGERAIPDFRKGKKSILKIEKDKGEKNKRGKDYVINKLSPSLPFFLHLCNRLEGGG